MYMRRNHLRDVRTPVNSVAYINLYKKLSEDEFLENMHDRYIS